MNQTDAGELEKARAELEAVRLEAEQAKLRWQSRLAEASSRLHEREAQLEALQDQFDAIARQLVQTAHESELRAAALERLQKERPADEREAGRLQAIDGAREQAELEARELEELEREAERAREKLKGELEAQLLAAPAALPFEPQPSDLEPAPADSAGWSPDRMPDLLEDMIGSPATARLLPRRVLDRAASLLLPAGTRRRGIVDWLQNRGRR